MKIISTLLLIFFVVLSCNAGEDTAARKKAEELCQKGRDIKMQMSSESGRPYWVDEIEFYEKAMAADSSYAPAYVYASDVYQPLAGIGEMTMEEAKRKRRWAAEKGLELDPDNAGAHIAMAWIQKDHDRDHKSAEASMQRALELEPQNSEIQRGYAFFLNSKGQFEEAVIHAKKSSELAPKSLQAKWAVAMISRNTGDFKQTIDTLNEMIKVNPNIIGTGGSPNCYGALGYTYILTGDYTKATEIAEKGLQTKPEHRGLKNLKAWSYFENGKFDEALEIYEETNSRSGLGWVYAKMNKKDKALSIVEELKTGENKDRWWRPWQMANIYHALGERNQVMDLLERTHDRVTKENNTWGLHWFGLWLTYYKEYDSLRSDPRFQTLIEKSGFKDMRMTSKP
jgi:tetratricopeptide (TPR) repeat protein